MTSPKKALIENRVALHPTSSKSDERMYIKVDDDTYKDRFDFEEVSAARVGSRLHRRYRVSSIPFVTYGINKGDTVELDKNRVVTRTLTDDGQYGYRIAFTSFSNDDEAHQRVEAVLKLLNEQNFETEFFNHKISAVNAINSGEAVRLENMLVDLIGQSMINSYDTIR